MENALASLRLLDTDEDAEVQGHSRASDENLKQAIASVTNALDMLKAINTKSGS